MANWGALEHLKNAPSKKAVLKCFNRAFINRNSKSGMPIDTISKEFTITVHEASEVRCFLMKPKRNHQLTIASISLLPTALGYPYYTCESNALRLVQHVRDGNVGNRGEGTRLPIEVVDRTGVDLIAHASFKRLPGRVVNRCAIILFRFSLRSCLNGVRHRC